MDIETSNRQKIQNNVSKYVPSSLGRWKHPGNKEALDISLFTVAVSLLFFVGGTMLSTIESSSSTLTFGLGALVDMVAALFVVWVYWGNSSNHALVESRGKKASVLISLMLLISAGITLNSVDKQWRKMEVVRDSETLLFLAIPSFVVLLFMGFLKVHISKEVKSIPVWKDAVSSLSTAGLSFGVIVGILVSRRESRFWYLDPLLALIISFGPLIAGIRGLGKGGKWWTPGYWTT